MGELTGTVAGRFQIDRPAGSGGMGAVYRAWDQSTGAVVALKVLHPQAAAQGERFEREAKLLSELDHPGIVRWVAFGQMDDGQRYLAMEWLDGESLSERIQRQLLSVSEALRVGELVAEALGQAHALGVVHRDLKPGNIFLVDRAIDRVKLLDFGMARASGPESDRLTHSGMLLGTPAYMAPEQVKAAKSVGPPADVFALGCVLFRSLTGRYVFQGDTPMEMAISAMMDAPPSLSSVRQDVPPELDALLSQLLAKNPAERPQDGKAAAALLRAAATGNRAAVRPTSSMPAVGEGRVLVLARPPAADDPQAPKLSDVRALCSQHDAELHLLADGTAVVMMSPRGTLAEQLARGAHCGLGLRQLAPNVGIALVAEQAADEQTRMAARAGVDLLGHAAPPAIVLNDLAARLLPSPFSVDSSTGRALLRTSAEASVSPADAPSAQRDSVNAFVQSVVSGPASGAAPGPANPASVAAQPSVATAATAAGAAHPAASAPATPAAAPIQANSFAMASTQRAGPPPQAASAGSPMPYPAAPAPFAAPLAPAPDKAGARISPGLLIGVGAGVLLLILLVAGVGGWLYLSGASPSSKRGDGPSKKAGAQACHADRCAPFKVPNPTQLEPVDVVSRVLQETRRYYPGAGLTMITIGDVRGGSVDLTQGDYVQFSFHLPGGVSESDLMVQLTQDSLQFRRDEDASADMFVPQAIASPKCKLSQARKVVEKHGFPKNAKGGWLYHKLPMDIPGKGSGPVWQLASDRAGLKTYRVDGATCAYWGG